MLGAIHYDEFEDLDFCVKGPVPDGPRVDAGLEDVDVADTFGKGIRGYFEEHIQLSKAIIVFHHTIRWSGFDAVKVEFAEVKHEALTVQLRKIRIITAVPKEFEM